MTLVVVVVVVVVVDRWRFDLTIGNKGIGVTALGGTVVVDVARLHLPKIGIS